MNSSPSSIGICFWFVLLLTIHMVTAMVPRDGDKGRMVPRESDKEDHQTSNPSLALQDETMPENLVRFMANDGNNFYIPTSTLEKYGDTPLKRVWDRREEMTASTGYVDASSPILDAILNFYRFSILECPSQVSESICAKYFDQFLPGVPFKGATPPKSFEIIFKVKVPLGGLRTSYGNLYYPAQYYSWINPLIEKAFGGTGKSAEGETSIATTDSLSFDKFRQILVNEDHPSGYRITTLSSHSWESDIYRDSEYIFRVEE